MTTTAAAWRHVDGGQGRVCWVKDDKGEYVCDCIDPTPDPASPCGWMYRGMGGYLIPCGMPDSTSHAHTHVPTRCLACGHALEAVR